MQALLGRAAVGTSRTLRRHGTARVLTIGVGRGVGKRVGASDKYRTQPGDPAHEILHSATIPSAGDSRVTLAYAG